MLHEVRPSAAVGSYRPARGTGTSPLLFHHVQEPGKVQLHHPPGAGRACKRASRTAPLPCCAVPRVGANASTTPGSTNCSTGSTTPPTAHPTACPRMAAMHATPTHASPRLSGSAPPSRMTITTDIPMPSASDGGRWCMRRSPIAPVPSRRNLLRA